LTRNFTRAKGTKDLQHATKYLGLLIVIGPWNEKEYKKLVDKVSSNIKTKLKLILKKYNKNLGNYLTGKEINELNTVRKRIGV
jgi:hypothetical protein